MNDTYSDPSTSPDQNPNDQESSKAQPASPEFDIQAFEATRAIITRQANRLEELKNEMKVLNEQLKSILENDQQLSEAQAEAKELSQKVKSRKAELMETSEAKGLKLKISDVKEERSDLEDSLTNHLLDLYQATGVMEFEDTQGHLWEYNLKAKLKARKSI